MSKSVESIQKCLDKLGIEYSSLEKQMAGVNEKNVKDINVTELAKRLTECQNEIEALTRKLEEIKMSSVELNDVGQDKVNYERRSRSYLKVRRLYPILNI